MLGPTEFCNAYSVKICRGGGRKSPTYFKRWLCCACLFLVVCVWCGARFIFEISYRENKNLTNQHSVMCTQTQLVEPTETHGENETKLLA